MVPYYHDDFMNLIKLVLSHTVKSGIIKTLHSGNQLLKFDLKKKKWFH